MEVFIKYIFFLFKIEMTFPYLLNSSTIRHTPRAHVCRGWGGVWSWFSTCEQDAGAKDEEAEKQNEKIIVVNM